VSELHEKLRRLSPQKRALLERMLVENAQGPRQAVFDPEALQSFTSTEARTKVGTRKFYDAINGQLAGTVFGDYSYFLNFGYVSEASDQSVCGRLPRHFPNRSSAQLVMELIGDCDLTGKRVLDIGCGRGGAIMIVDKYFEASLKIGLDLSSQAIAFCNRTHRNTSTFFLEGDAEQVPFAASSFEVIGNIESSHSYPHAECFFREVWRVLAPGAVFLYTDVYSPARFAEHQHTLRSIGFAFERERDITSNVLRSCRDGGRWRANVFDRAAERSVIHEFLSTPESGAFAAMDSGEAVYKMFRLRKAG
jgi:ubiquinone/menaquinone biosynthesis C-methylase UbiE